MLFKTDNKTKEAHLVAGLCDEYRSTQYDLYAYCSDYFYQNYRGIFFAAKEDAADIYQNTFIKLWENIEQRKIYAENGVLKGKDAQPLRGSLLTYFMGIAKIKYLEWVRNNPATADLEEETIRLLAGSGNDAFDYIDILYDDGNNVMYDIIADIISRMSPRCSQILTKFYYEAKSPDCILSEIPSIESKTTLKSRKYKCMETLRQAANDIYSRYLNS